MQNKLSWINQTANEIYDPVDSQSLEMEDMAFPHEYTDNELKRTNPPRYDKRKDWNNQNPDDEVSARSDQTVLESSASWRQIFSWKVAQNFKPNVSIIIAWLNDLEMEWGIEADRYDPSTMTARDIINIYKESDLEYSDFIEDLNHIQNVIILTPKEVEEFMNLAQLSNLIH